MIRVGRYTLQTEHMPCVQGFASVVGKKEGEGPLGRYYDHIFDDTTLGESSWEKAESRLQTEAVNRALDKANVAPNEVDYIFAGDLLNQCISSTFGLRSLGIPFLGQYGACSTMAQTLALAAIFVETGTANRCVAVTSSHFCSAERQFRFPLEYGGQRTPTAQWTATAAGAAVIGNTGESPYISAITFGRINDLGIKDTTNMGAAMAPAAAQTLMDYLKDTATSVNDYDLILTGDLGKVGSDLMLELLEREGIHPEKEYADCGLLLYDRQGQDVHAGGSGCGCSAAVLNSYIMQRLKQGELEKVLFIGTGALMSPTSSQQGESVPGIAHLVCLRSSAQ
jgi:stage V sporulation protein AD